MVLNKKIKKLRIKSAYFFLFFPYQPPTRIEQMSAPTQTPTQNPVTQTPTAVLQAQQAQQELVPAPAVLLQAARLALKEEKGIFLDYYVDTATGKAFMGEDPTTKEKMLVKSADEFTSVIQGAYKVGDDFIVMTENSIYITHKEMKKRKILGSSLRHE